MSSYPPHNYATVTVYNNLILTSKRKMSILYHCVLGGYLVFSGFDRWYIITNNDKKQNDGKFKVKIRKLRLLHSQYICII